MALTDEQKRQNKIDRVLARFKGKSIGGCLDETAAKFQKLVRLEEADEFGIVQCVTCGKHVNWKSANGGHFHSRRHVPTLLDRRNVHSQCVHCNLYGAGNAAEYLIWMQENYSQDVLEDLVKLRRSEKRYTKLELAELYVGYLEQIKELEKGLDKCF